MAEEATNIQEIKTSSDGTVKLAIEKYNELVDKIASQQVEIERSRTRLARALAEPPVINRTIINKTPEMLAKEHRVSGITLMGLGTAMLVVGALRFKAGHSTLA